MNLVRLIPIKSNERVAVTYFFLLMLTFSFGASIARSVGMTLLIQHLGGDVLPHVFMLIDGIAMFAFIAYANYSKKVSELPLLYFFFAIAAIFTSILVVLLVLFEVRILYGVFFVGFFLGYIMISIHVASVVAAYFSTVQLKRVTNIINIGLPIGGMLGGGSLLLFLQFVDQPSWLLSLTALAYFLALILLKQIGKRLSPIRSGHNRFSSNRGAIKELKSAFSYIIHARLMMYMAIGMVLFVIASKFMEYQYQAMIYPEMFPDPTVRATFFAVYEFCGNLAWLLIQILVTSRLLPLLGVGASNLLHPVLMILGAIGLVFRFGFTAGVISHFINQEMRGALRTPAHNLLFNAVPPNMWGATKAFLNGIAFPIATIIASVSLLLLKENLEDYELRFYLPILTLFLSGAAIFAALPQWAAYNEGVFGLLRRRLFAGKNQLAKEKALLRMIEEKLDSSKSQEVVAALEMIRLLKADDFVHRLGAFLHRSNLADNVIIKRYCIQALAALPPSKLVMTHLCNALRNEHNTEILTLLLNTLDQYHQADKSLIGYIEKFLLHPSPAVFVAACLCLHHHPDYTQKTMLEERLLARIKNRELPQFERYLAALGDLQQTRYSHVLLPFLDDPRDQVQLAAFKAHIQLLHDQLEGYKDSFVKALASPNKEIKIAALHALKECSTIHDWQPVIQLLGSPERALVDESKELLRLRLSRSKSALLTTLFSNQSSVEQSFEILSLIYQQFTQTQKTRLGQDADDSFRQFIYTQGLLLLYKQYEPNHSSKALAEKILQELSETHLQRLLVAITYLSNESLEFFQRISRGLLSHSKANQGNALEVISNVSEKHLSGRLLYYYENHLDDIKRLESIHQKLFEHGLPLEPDNYHAHLFNIQHDLLRACLYHVAQQQELDDGYNLDLLYENKKTRDLLGIVV